MKIYYAFFTDSRISAEDLSKAVNELGDETTTYICGPVPMIDDVTSSLCKIGVKEDKIIYEKWW